MQGHCVAEGKARGKSVRAVVAHVLEISDGKLVRFDPYVDSATINAILGAARTSRLAHARGRAQSGCRGHPLAPGEEPVFVLGAAGLGGG